MFKKENQYHALLDIWSQQMQLDKDVGHSTCVH